jgi:hypothetical protein
MLQIRTKMSYETAQQTLVRLLAKGETATGELTGDTFFLRLIPRNRQTEVKLRGHIVPDNGGSLLCASPCLPWAAIILLPIFTGIVIALHASIWFIVLSFSVVVFNFLLATRRGYNFLRKMYAG